AFVVLRKLIHGLASLIPFGDDGRGDTCSDEHGPAEANARVDHDRPRLFRGILAGEGIEPRGLTTHAPFDALEVDGQHLPHSELTLLSDGNQSSELGDEEVNAVRLEALRR